MVLRQAARLLDCPRLLQQGCLLPLPYQQGGRAKRLCSSRSCLNLKIWSRYVFAGTRDGLARGDCSNAHSTLASTRTRTRTRTRECRTQAASNAARC